MSGQQVQTSFDKGVQRFTWLMIRFMMVMVPFVFVVNGALKQDSNTGQMLFTVAEQIAQLSINMTLHPGDLILTGTPAGTGGESGTFLKTGDVVKLWIEGIGEFGNRIA